MARSSSHQAAPLTAWPNTMALRVLCAGLLLIALAGCSSGGATVTDDEPAATELVIGEENRSTDADQNASDSADTDDSDNTDDSDSDGTSSGAVDLNTDVISDETSTDEDQASNGEDVPVDSPSLTVGCDAVPTFASPLDVACSGDWAASPELFASNAGWHIFERNEDAWTEIDYGLTCCEDQETTLDLLLERSLVPLDDLANICDGTDACEDTVLACQNEQATSTATVVNVSQAANLRIGPATHHPTFGELARGTSFAYLPEATIFAEGRHWLLVIVEGDGSEVRNVCAWMAADLASDEDGRALGSGPADFNGVRLQDPGDPDLVHTMSQPGDDYFAVAAFGYDGFDDLRFAVGDPYSQIRWTGSSEQLMVTSTVLGNVGDWVPSTTIVYELNSSSNVWEPVFTLSNLDARDWIGGDLAYYRLLELDTSADVATAVARFWSVDEFTRQEVEAATATCTRNPGGAGDAALDCQLVPIG